MKVRLLKNLTSNGVELHIGEIVDASNWKNTRTLIKNRFVEIAGEETKAIETKPKIKKATVSK